MKDIQIEYENMIFRHVRENDIKKIYQDLYQPLDKEVIHYTGSKSEFSEEEVTTYFKNAIVAKDRYHYILLDETGKTIAESVINDIDDSLRSGSFRIAIFSKDHRSKGLGKWIIRQTLKIAFENLKLHRLELEVYSFNERAKRAYLSAGFQVEGILRDAIKDNENYADVILMSMLESEYNEFK